MKSLILFIISLIGFSRLTLCQDTTFTQKEFESGEVFYKTSQIPKFIKQKYAEINYRFKMADTGQYYEATDCITKPSAPRARLICFIKMRNRYLLYYERGGFGWCTHYELYEVNNDKVNDVWSIDVKKACQNFPYKILKEILIKHEYVCRKYK